jgi:hypothetical protein
MGLKLGLIGGPHSKEKTLRRPQTTRKALKISLIRSKFIILSIFGMFVGRTNASGGSHVACMPRA